MADPARDRILRSASHPITIGAVLVLLVNDHVLRHLSPGWMTGKIGDVAWLIFAPLIAAALISIMMPRRDRAAIIAGMLIVGMLFTAGKTLPAVRDGIVAVLNAIFGRPFQLAVDPTDLITLPALLITWFIWKQSQWSGQRTTRGSWGWLIAGAVLSIANMGMPHYGISCVYEIDEGIIGASAFYPSYFSTDGGRSWREGWPQNVDPPTVTPCEFDGMLDTPIGEFLFTRHAISRSTDGGQTWVQEIRITGAAARYAYYERVRPEAYQSFPDVFDALYDESSGNLIAAMGQDGILIREPDGNWEWIGVGPYVRESLARPDKILLLLWGEYLLSLFISVLAVHVGSKLAVKDQWAKSEIIETVLAILLLLATCIVSPALSWAADNYITPPLIRGLAILVGVTTLPMLPNIIRMLRASPGTRRRRWLISAAVVWVACSLLYTGWGVGIVDVYYVSAGLVWLTAIGAVILISRYRLVEYPIEANSTDEE